MGDVIDISSRRDEPLQVWLCAMCDCALFLLLRSGDIQCGKCGEWITRVHVDMEQSDG